MSVNDRSSKMNAVVLSLEQDLNLLGLTGVEDKLQEGVQPTLELLRNAGIKVISFPTSIFTYLHPSSIPTYLPLPTHTLPPLPPYLFLLTPPIPTFLPLHPPPPLPLSPFPPYSLLTQHTSSPIDMDVNW